MPGDSNPLHFIAQVHSGNSPSAMILIAVNSQQGKLNNEDRACLKRRAYYSFCKIYKRRVLNMRFTYIPYTDNLFVKTETEEHFTAALNAASDADKMKEVVVERRN